MVAGVIALLASLAGAVIGWVIIDSIAGDLGNSVGVSESVLTAIEETVNLVESVASEVDGSLSTASDSIESAADAGEDTSGRLEDVADFLDGDLVEDIEALQRSMPAAIQAAGAIDDTLGALSLFGVEYDPDEPFDVSLMAVEDALSGLPDELVAQAAAVRGLVPASRQFAEDASALAGSLRALGGSLESSQEVIVSYRDTLERARSVVGDTDSSLTSNILLLRSLVITMALTGVALSVGLITLARHAASRAEVIAGQPEPELAAVD
jgi:hypothetical protein